MEQKLLITLANFFINSMCITNGDWVGIKSLSLDFMAYKEVNVVLVFAKFNEPDCRIMAKDFNAAGKMFYANNRCIDIFSLRRMFSERVALILIDEKLTNNIVLQHASINNRFTSRQHWLIISEEHKHEEVWENLNINIDSDITLASSAGFGYNLYNVYDTGFSKKCVLKVQPMGSWSTSKGLQIVNRFKSVIGQRSNLGGQHLVAAEVSIFKFVNKTLKKHLVDLKDRQADVIAKTGYAFVSTLSRMFNTTLQLHRTTRFGVIVNGSFDGQIGLIQRREVDIGGTMAYMRKERLPFVDYIGQNSYQRSIILFKQPAAVRGFSPRAFLKPLSLGVWYSTAAVTILAITLLSLGNYVENVLVVGHQTTKIPQIVLTVISVYCQQGLYLRTTLASMQMSFMNVLMFSFIIYQFYSASIMSSLLAPPPTPIKTTKDLSESSLKLIIENLIYHDTFFKETYIEDAKIIYANKGYNGTVKSIYKTAKEGLSLVNAGGYMLYGDSDTLYASMQGMPMTDICAISELYFIKKSYFSIAIQKGSPLRNLFSVGLRTMAERGVARKESSVWKSQKPQCLSELVGTTVSVGLPEVSSAFILLGIGMTTAMMLLVFEIIRFKRTDRNFGHRASTIEFLL